MDSFDYQKMLDKCIYDYFVKKGMHESAKIFAREANVEIPTDDAIESLDGSLEDWWDEFYRMFSSNQAEHAQEPYAEAARTMDIVVPRVPYTVPASSPHAARPARNISPVVPAFSPERLQGQCHPRTPEDEVTSNLRFLELDHPSQRATFVTDSSSPMEQILDMPQQWEARVEGEGRGIYLGQTMQMANSDTPENAMLPVPDPSEAGSSTGSCSEMPQTP